MKPIHKIACLFMSGLLTIYAAGCSNNNSSDNSSSSALTTTVTTASQTTTDKYHDSNGNKLDDSGIVVNYSESECTKIAREKVSGSGIKIGSVVCAGAVVMQGSGYSYYRYEFTVKGNETYTDEYGHYHNKDFSKRIKVRSDTGT